MVSHDEHVLVVLHVGVGVLIRFKQLERAVEDLHGRAHVQPRVRVHLLTVGLVYRLPLQELAACNAAVADWGLKHLEGAQCIAGLVSMLIL